MFTLIYDVSVCKHGRTCVCSYTVKICIALIRRALIGRNSQRMKEMASNIPLQVLIDLQTLPLLHRLLHSITFSRFLMVLRVRGQTTLNADTVCLCDTLTCYHRVCDP